MRIAILVLTMLAFAASQAQDTPTPAPSVPASPTPLPSPPPPPPRHVPLRFALPPLAGTISLGIYDRAGKLVRVLHREDAITEFTAGNDALETEWDGLEDDENPLPPGKYSARGYVVGDLKVEGVDYFFNDWVTDEKSPHIRRLTQLWMENGELRVDAELAGARKTAFVCDQTTGALLKEVAPLTGSHCNQSSILANVLKVIDCAPGRNGTIWSVDAFEGGGPRQVRQLSSRHEVLRRLEYVKDDPQPERIEASTTEEKIFVLEQNALLQRFRGLGLVRTMTDGAEGAVSDWKGFFDKKIIEHQNFSLLHNRPVAIAATPPGEPDKFVQKLLPNPLQNDRPGMLDLEIGFDAEGSYLKTADGLPLRTISDTQNLSRALLARKGDNALDVFQDDGAVVEQYRVSGLAQMMAFDCGDFELK